VAARLGSSEGRCVSRVQIRTIQRKSFTLSRTIDPGRRSAVRRAPARSSATQGNIPHRLGRMSLSAVEIAAASLATSPGLHSLKRANAHFAHTIAQKLPRLTPITRAQSGALDGVGKAICGPRAGRSSITRRRAGTVSSPVREKDRSWHASPGQ